MALMEHNQSSSGEGERVVDGKEEEFVEKYERAGVSCKLEPIENFKGGIKKINLGIYNSC